MESIIVARTTEKERYDVDNGTWYSEYRARRIHDTERYELIKKYHFDCGDAHKPYIIEHRRMDVDGITKEHTPYEASQEGGWRIYGFGMSVKLAIRELIGDTSFFEANSLCDEHREEVERAAKLHELYAERHELEECFKPMPYPHKLCSLQQKWQDQYENELRKRRLMKKVENGTADELVVAEIRKPFYDGYKKEAKETRARLIAVNREIEALEKS